MEAETTTTTATVVFYIPNSVFCRYTVVAVVVVVVECLSKGREGVERPERDREEANTITSH